MEKGRIKYLIKKSVNTIKSEGIKSFFSKAKNFVVIRKKGNKKFASYKDVLFINGCFIPHPQRYRVDHQIEQLEAYGVSCHKINFDVLDLKDLKYYRSFVFYRCPITPTIEEFIKKAHYFNKKCFFDIDDLVINTKYTNSIPYIQQMSKDEKALYDDGVNRMEKTLKLCDHLITSTTRLGKELEAYGKSVYVNRNVASERMAELSLEALKKVKKNSEKIVIGYLSGSITHNSDFELIKESVIKIMKKHSNVYLELMGEIDMPSGFEGLSNQIIFKPFCDWQELPKVIAGLDINLAPLEDSIFNEAKSENKWTEAALCKVVTIASNIGAFKEKIVNNKTGILCDNPDDWYDALEMLISQPELRKEIATNAYNEVIKKSITTYSGLGISKYILSKLVRNFAFVLPTTNISGGVNVVVKHCNILRENGYDPMIINMDKPSDNIINADGEVNVVSNITSNIIARFDTMIATLWATLIFVKEYHSVKNRKYLVQGFETDFGKIGQGMRITANATYNSMDYIKYITVSKWCQKWLKENYEKNALYAPNGIDIKRFEIKERSFKGKIKILIEGNPDDFFKNVDESFKIVEKLDKNKFEIHFLSYQGKRKDWYWVDKFYHKIPHDEVGKVYNEADILLKSSFLESFSYPPLEMMATGGVCVVVKNDGNVEYLKDKQNCLFYEKGNIDDAIEKINIICNDNKLRNTIIKNGLVTASKRNWEKIKETILKMYE